MFRPRSRTGPLLALALLTACQAQDKLGPSLPTAPTDLSRYAYYLQIDLEQGTIAVTPPARPGPGTGTTAGLRPAFSLMGSDIIALTTSNFTRSAVGAVVPNKRTITFDLAITNRLSVSDLVTPTFPQPPAGIQGLIAFPYTVAPAGTQGGKAVPDNNWDGDGSPGSGAPTNLFNDFATCPTGAQSDCYRWELFPAPLAPGATTAPRKVGFTVGAGVTSVGVYLVVAADLLDHPPPPPPPGQGAIIGTVSSSLGGALAGVTVTATPGGSTTTDGVGGYVLTALPVGPLSLTVSGLPSECTAPAPAPVTITSGGLTSAHLVATCVPTNGSILGQMLINDATPSGNTTFGGWVGIAVSIGGQTTMTAADGSFLLNNVPAGSYPLSPANFPSLGACTLDAPVTVVVTGGLQTRQPFFLLTCQSSVEVFTSDLTNGGYLGGALVTLTSGAQVYSGSSDANGVFSVPALRTGTYTLTVIPPPGCTVAPNQPTQVTVAPYGVPTGTGVGFDCVPRFATITGGVTGQPFVDLSDGSTEQAFGGVEVSAPSGLTTVIGMVDPVGHYSLPALTPGTYTLQLLSPPPGSWGLLLQCFPTGPVQVTVPAGGGTVTAPDLSTYCTRGGVRGTVQFDQPFQGGRVVSLDPLATAPTDPGAVLSYMDISAGVMASYYAVTVPDQVATDIRVEAASTLLPCQPAAPQVLVPAGRVVQVDFACQ